MYFIFYTISSGGQGFDTLTSTRLPTLFKLSTCIKYLNYSLNLLSKGSMKYILFVLLFVFLCLAISVLSDVDYPSAKCACHSCNDCFISHKLGSAVL